MLGQGPGFLLLQAALRGQDSRCIPIAFLGCLGGEGCSICYCAPISPATPGPPPAPHTQQPCNSCLHQRPEGSFRSTNRSMALLCENPEWLPAMVWLPMSLAGPGPASTCSLILHPSLPARCSLYTLALLPFLSHTKLVLLYSLCPALFTLGLRVTLPFTSPTLQCPWPVCGLPILCMWWSYLSSAPRSW